MKDSRLLRLKLLILFVGIGLLFYFGKDGFYAVNTYTDIYEKSFDNVGVNSVVETDYSMSLGCAASLESVSRDKSGNKASRASAYYYVVPVSYENGGKFITVKISPADRETWAVITDNTYSFVENKTETPIVTSGVQSGFVRKSDSKLDKSVSNLLVEVGYAESVEEAQNYILPYTVDITEKPMNKFYATLLALAVFLVGLLWLTLPLVIKRNVISEENIFQVEVDTQVEKTDKNDEDLSQEKGYS